MMMNEVEMELRREIAELKKRNADAVEETKEYKNKYEGLAKLAEEEINKRTELENYYKSLQVNNSNTANTNKGNITYEAPLLNNDALANILQESQYASSGLRDLQNRWSQMDYNLNNVLHRVGKLAQYSQINSLLFYGFPTIPKGMYGRKLRKHLVDELNKLFPDLEGGPVQEWEIEFGHTLKSKSKKHVAIIKFNCRFTRNAIYYSKSTLPKDCGVTVREHLTYDNKTLLIQAIKAVGHKNVWTSQTNIFAKVNGSKWAISCDDDIRALQNAVSNPYKWYNNRGFQQVEGGSTYTLW